MLSTTGQATLIALGVFLISLLTLSWYKQGMPPFARGQAAESQTQRPAQSQNDAEHDRSAAQSRAPEQNGANSQKERHRTQGDTSNKEETDADLANYTFWLTAFTAILAIATIGLVIATVGLWWYASEQAGDMKDSIAAAVRAAKAAEKAATVAERTLVEADRPIIEILGADIDLFGEKNEGKPTIAFNLSNIGGKPAFIDSSFMQITIIDSPMPIASDQFDAREVCPIVFGEIAVPASSSLHATCSRATAITDIERDKIRTKQIQIYFHGNIRYRSALGTNWIKGFVKAVVLADNGSPYLQTVIEPGRNFERRTDAGGTEMQGQHDNNEK